MGLWRIAAAAALVAVGGAWLAFGRRGSDVERAARSLPAPSDRIVIDLPTQPPTLLAYRLALAQSPAALDALLNEHATTSVAFDAEVTPVGVFTYWNSTLRSSLGEM
jgi:hypothetical protein